MTAMAVASQEMLRREGELLNKEDWRVTELNQELEEEKERKREKEEGAIEL